MNAACSIDRQDRVGSLEPGKLMDAVIVEGDVIDLIRVGAGSISRVIKRGRVVHGRDRRSAVEDDGVCPC
jgi:imidazolonepropionase-like amidohydrolase